MWKRLSQKSGQGWVKNLSKYVAQHNWTDVWLKKWHFVLFFYCFLWKSHSPFRQKKIFEKQKGKRKLWTDFWLKKGNFWTDFWLYSIFLCRVKIWSKIRLSSSWNQKIGSMFVCFLLVSYIFCIGSEILQKKCQTFCLKCTRTCTSFWFNFLVNVWSFLLLLFVVTTNYIFEPTPKTGNTSSEHSCTNCRNNCELFLFCCHVRTLTCFC